MLIQMGNKLWFVNNQQMPMGLEFKIILLDATPAKHIHKLYQSSKSDQHKRHLIIKALNVLSFEKVLAISGLSCEEVMNLLKDSPQVITNYCVEVETL